MSEKQLSTIEIGMGNGPKGGFEYEIHEVINQGVKQFRLRLWDYKDKLNVRFAKTVDELLDAMESLLVESAR